MLLEAGVHLAVKVLCIKLIIKINQVVLIYIL